MKIETKAFLNLLNSFVVAFMINLHLINYAITAYVGSSTGFSTILYLAFFIVSIICWLLQGKLTLDLKWLIVFVGIILWHIINISVSRIETIMLCAYVGMPLFIMNNIKYSTNQVLFFTMLISAAFLPGFSVMLDRTGSLVVDVDVAYSVLPSIIAGMTYFVYYRANNVSIYSVLIYAIPLYYAVQLMLRGQRGPIFCIVLIAFLMSVFTFDELGKLKTKKLSKRALALFLIVLILIAFLEPLLKMLIYLFETLNIESHFITKTSNLLKKGDLLNGRYELWNIALQGFIKHPIFGNGFDSFEHNTGIGYAHNFILQALYDGGIVFFTILLAIFVYGVKIIIKNKDKDNCVMLIFLSGFAVTYPLLSQDMFDVYYLWAILGFMLHQRMNHKKIQIK